MLPIKRILFSFLGLVLPLFIWNADWYAKQLSYSRTLVSYQEDNVRKRLEGHQSWAQEHQSKSSYEIEELVVQCLEATNMNSSYLISQAKINARRIYEELRRVIPANSLKGYKSHCWKESYSTKWKDKIAASHIGNTNIIKKIDFLPNKVIIDELQKEFPNNKYKSNMVCMPNVFLAGFMKCGSTFFSEVYNKMMSTKRLRIVKEVKFWVRDQGGILNRVHVPSVGLLGEYLLNYLPGLQQISEFDLKDIMLMDGTPNIMNSWPIFNMTQKLINYCLVPSVVPNLFPRSKFVVIMRNPLHMLYSLFWYDCTAMHHKKISWNKKQRGHDIFHNRVISKIYLFNNCMKDDSIPSISAPCVLNSKDEYYACIKQRIHLLDKCTIKVLTDRYTQGLKCGAIWLQVAIYFTHVRKWLSIVPRDRFLFIKLEDFTSSNTQQLHEISEFIGLDNSITENEGRIEQIMKKSNKNKQHRIAYEGNPKLRMRRDTEALLKIFFHPFNTLLAELVNDDRFIWT